MNFHSLKVYAHEIRRRINEFVRKPKVKRYRARLKNSDFTIFSCNCLGGIIYHDLNLPFLAPLINGGMDINHFLIFCQNWKAILEEEPIFLDSDSDLLPSTSKNKKFPVAKIGPIIYRFTHYKEKEKAQNDWNRRKDRINPNKVYFLMMEKKGCTYEDLVLFDSLPLPHKAVLTHKPYPEIKCSVYIPGFEKLGYLGVLSEYRPNAIGQKYYDSFDFVDWLNQ